MKKERKPKQMLGFFDTMVDKIANFWYSFVFR